jgi:hypothetical protein
MNYKTALLFSALFSQLNGLDTEATAGEKPNLLIL